MLRKLSCTLTAKFEEKLLRQLKQIELIRRDYGEENKFKQKSYILTMKIKINIILFFKKSFS